MAALVSSVAGLLLIEVGLRVLTPHPITSLSNRVQDEVLLYRLSSELPGIDAEGFRASSAPLRIAAIGDSFTYGTNVRVEETWPAYYAALIGEPVHNWGVPSYNVYQYSELVRRAAARGAREIVVGFYPANDLRLYVCEIVALDVWQQAIAAGPLEPLDCAGHEADYYERFRDPSDATFWPSLWRGLRRRSALVSVVHERLDLPQRLEVVRVGGVPLSVWRQEARLFETDLDLPFVATSYANSEHLFREMRDASAAAGARFGVVIIPSQTQLARQLAQARGEPIPPLVARAADSLQRIEDRYLAFFRASGIPATSARTELASVLEQAVATSEDLYSVNDDHPRGPGYRAIAEAAVRLRGEGGRAPPR